jgi:TolA-binding protein
MGHLCSGTGLGFLNACLYVQLSDLQAELQTIALRLEAGLQPTQLQQQLLEAQGELQELQQHAAMEEATATKYQQELQHLQQQHEDAQACKGAAVEESKSLAKQLAAAAGKHAAVEAALSAATQQLEELGEKFPEEVMSGTKAAANACISSQGPTVGCAASGASAAAASGSAAAALLNGGLTKGFVGREGAAEIKQLQRKLQVLEGKLDRVEESAVIPAEELVSRFSILS